MSQLSQQPILQKVRSWSEKKCKDDYEIIMPQILHEIIVASSSETVELCSLVHEKFLSHAMVDELGQKIFNTVSVELVRVFNQTMKNLPGSHQDSAAPTLSNTVEVLKCLVKVLTCFNGFILRLVSFVKSAVQIDLLYISEFSNNTIDILQKSYSHCKNSEKDYGQLFRHVSGLLGTLFQKTYGMQKNFGFIIANIKQTPELILSDETKTAVEKLCHGLLFVCETTCTLDNTLLTSTWTTMVKFMKEFMDVVQEKIYPNPYIVLLCDNIAQCVRYSIQLHDQSHRLLSSGDESTKKALNQSLKYAKLLMSILYELVKIFDAIFNQGLASHILLFFHDFHELLAVKDSSNCPDTVRIKFRCKMKEQLPHYDHVIALILSNSDFLDHFSTFSFDSQKLPDYGWLHVWLSMSKELVKSKSVMAQWEKKRFDCIALLVNLIVECVGPTFNVSHSHFNERLSLYETNLVIVCSLLSQLSSDVFTKAEEVMLDSVLSSSPTKSIFSADVFVFLAKSCTTLSKRYKSVIAAILGTIATSNVKKVTFPLLMLISISNRIGVSSKDVVKNLSSLSNEMPHWLVLIQNNNFDHSDIPCAKVSTDISNVSQQSDISVANMHDLCKSMIQLELAFNSHVIAKKEMLLLKSAISSLIKTIFQFEKHKGSVDSNVFSEFLSHFLASLYNFMSLLPTTEKTKVFKHLQTLMVDGVSAALPIKLSIIDIFSRCEDTPSESLDAISAIFQKLFLDENWLIRHLALTTFITLTLNPPQTALLEKCASDVAISEIIEGYLAFDSEASLVYHAPLPKSDDVYVAGMEKCISFWGNQRCKRSESLLIKENACLGKDCFRRCVSKVQIEIRKLDQVISQNSINIHDIGSEDLQNLSSIKTALDQLLHKFNL